MELEKLKFYRIDINYIKYLYQFDKRVQYNKNREDEYTKRRVYLGIVMQVNDINYSVPLEHPRPEHQKIKNNIFIFRIHRGRYGMLGLNNMIPVRESELIKFDINSEKQRYKQILISQYHFCNKHIKEIKNKAIETYNKSLNNKFLKKFVAILNYYLMFIGLIVAAIFGIMYLGSILL